MVPGLCFLVYWLFNQQSHHEGVRHDCCRSVWPQSDSLLKLLGSRGCVRKRATGILGWGGPSMQQLTCFPPTRRQR